MTATAGVQPLLQAEGTVLEMYEALNSVPDHASLADHAVEVVRRYFAESFVGHGGPENHDYDRTAFETIVRAQFGRHPDFRAHVEDVLSRDDRSLVRIRLSDGETEVNYMALYLVREGSIVERWAYGDDSFR